MKKLIFSLCAFALTATAVAQPLMKWDEANRKADALLKTLTLDEKIEMTHGHNKFFLPGVPEKGLPYVFMVDASSGVRINYSIPNQKEVRHPLRTTQFPSTITIAATFNPELASEFGKAVGEETRMSGAGILLGPGMNIYRSSQCGRNFEYLGEDPVLAARMVENYVKGMQSTGTLSCLKHFLCNNTEFYRRNSNSVVDERAIMEIYTPAFKAGIDAGAASVMTAYNLLNGEWCGQSKYVITDLLRKTLGFKGLVMTDWHSVYDWKKIVLSGQNVEMPGDMQFDFPASVRELVDRKELTEKDLDKMLKPMIATCVRYGLYERFKNGQPNEDHLVAKMPDHLKVSYQTAAEGTILLKNNGILPLGEERQILLIGRWANKLPQGGGSSKVVGYNHITPADALRSVTRTKVTVREVPTIAEMRKADVIICATGTIDSEGTERPFALEAADEELIRLAVELNPNTIVLVNSGSGIDMSGWNDKAAAVLYGWYPGQNGFEAIADIIVGNVNPSGKLPMTIERSFKDSPAANLVPKNASLSKAKGNPNEKLFHPATYDVHYSEGVFVGYRWYESKNIKPLYPFGFGLSYTSFALNEAKAENSIVAPKKPATVSVTLTNTGKREGAEVVQLYVTENNPTVARPKKELKAFKKVTLAPGAKQVVTFEVNHQDLAFWNEQTHKWQVNPGEYTVSLGTSSADIAAQVAVSVEK